MNGSNFESKTLENNFPSCNLDDVILFVLPVQENVSLQDIALNERTSTEIENFSQTIACRVSAETTVRLSLRT